MGTPSGQVSSKRGRQCVPRGSPPTRGRWEREAVADDDLGHPHDPVICSLKPTLRGKPVIRHTIRERFRTACKPLVMERLRILTIHHGRHTFVSHALAGGRTLAEVKAVAGHSSLVTTSVYLHIAVDDDATPGRLFASVCPKLRDVD